MANYSYVKHARTYHTSIHVCVATGHATLYYVCGLYAGPPNAPTGGGVLSSAEVTDGIGHKHNGGDTGSVQGPAQA